MPMATKEVKKSRSFERLREELLNADYLRRRKISNPAIPRPANANVEGSGTEVRRIGPFAQVEFEGAPGNVSGLYRREPVTAVNIAEWPAIQQKGCVVAFS